MFLRVSVILFTGGGLGLGPGGSLSQGGLCLGGSLSGGVSVWGGLCLGGSISGGISVQGGLCHGDPRTVTSGRYASYWNAFLLINEK